MLDQYRDEPLETAEDRAVDDYHAVLGVVRADVFQVEPLGHHVIELNRRALPLSSNGIGDVEVDLRAVEGAVLRIQCVLEACALERGAQLRLRMIPRRHVTKEFIGS